MKKRKIANIVMAAVLVMIAAAGILAVGAIQGWFEKADGKTAVLTDTRGIVNLRRQGVSYPVEAETVLRAGDEIACTPGATAVIHLGGGYLTLGESAGMAVSDPDARSFTAGVTAGEVFVNITDSVTLTFGGKEITFTDAVASLSVRSGAQSIGVFAGTVENAKAGQTLNWAGDALSVTELSIDSLNDFTIGQIRTANLDKVLCFTNADLDQLAADRQAQMQAQGNPTLPEETEVSETQPAETQPEETMAAAPEPSQPAAMEPPAEETKPSAGETLPPETEPPAGEALPPETEPPVTETTPPETEAPETEKKLTCTLSIRCDTILNNWENLNPAKAGFVPGDGRILYAAVEFTEGETVFDVLKRACSEYGISLEYSYSPIYGSYYIEGINNLYQYDCGTQSGWMYKVNGWFPNYGCSAYPLSDRDVIVWCYTCNGYGADVGA